MPEEPEVETKELQETIEELQEERKERAESERRGQWTRYVALSTAILAVFAAIGAMQSGSLVNEAMLAQLKASDTWNEYQAARQKDHLYSIEANRLIDAGARPPAEAAAGEPGAKREAAPAPPRGRAPRAWRARPPDERLRAYIGQVTGEAAKEEEKSAEAARLERESRELMARHERFALAVALIQVSIALSAVAALTRIRSVWVLSMVVGLAGIAGFLLGFAR